MITLCTGVVKFKDCLTFSAVIWKYILSVLRNNGSIDLNNKSVIIFCLLVHKKISFYIYQIKKKVILILLITKFVESYMYYMETLKLLLVYLKILHFVWIVGHNNFLQ